ncbi:hypothetical protein [Kroppenstedtia pulmonis]|uniref:hypothetical protein n=1 Tax=Kroppenstedtia pulmonis TaxID=1380685 RepID=UPI00156438D1|nr:hypothetical protein [Kroppenstedtia pulmonis]
MNSSQTALLTAGVVICALVAIAIIAYSISKSKPAKTSRRSAGFTSSGTFYDHSSGSTNDHGGWSSGSGDCGSGDSGGGGDCGGGGGD